MCTSIMESDKMDSGMKLALEGKYFLLTSF
jgi:hypothetical protein